MPTNPAAAVDDTDLRILDELSRDGRLSNKALAERVGLSASPCWNRVRAMEAAGVIEGYTTVLNYPALGLRETFLVEVTLEKHGGDAMDAFARAVAEMPEVVESSMLAGDCDFQLKVAVRDTADYERFLRARLYRAPGLREIRSRLVLQTTRAAHLQPGLR